ncbi:MAG: hypothetical protein LBR50_10155 [Tannerella sp.]|nr:hypothetical protein [Tannerella sp.]
MKYILLIVTLLQIQSIAAQQQQPDINPLDLEFHRLAVRRFIFSNNLPLTEFKPSEIVAFGSMHPPFAVNTTASALPDTTFKPTLKSGKLLLEASTSAMKEACFYVGAVNPYATYDVDIDELTDGAEVGIDLARLGLRERVQVMAAEGKGLYFRLWEDAKQITERRFTDILPDCPFKLRVQLYGRTLGVFTEKEGVTTYHGHLDDHPYSAKTDTFHFGNVLDFRNITLNSHCTFNVVYNLKGQAVIGGARSYLSAGIGQADIRLISYEDLTPYISDDGRLWFTFTMRGIGIRQPSQGVLSLDPSVFDVRFEGAIAFDFGDGLLRNAVASHLFYDRNAKEWRGISCDFGGSKNRDGRSESNLFTIRSAKDPRRGFSIMQAELITNDRLIESHEDPCLFYDGDARKWRLLTSGFAHGGIEARMFEADTWDGKYTEITPAIKRNSTGTVIQKIGDAYYCLMGGAGENLRVHSYPDLTFLGYLNLDLQPHWPQPAARIWAQVVPLPEGYPYRYILLTMDRPNFPGVKNNTWSYGALYFYGANFLNNNN